MARKDTGPKRIKILNIHGSLIHVHGLPMEAGDTMDVEADQEVLNCIAGGYVAEVKPIGGTEESR